MGAIVAALVLVGVPALSFDVQARIVNQAGVELAAHYVFPDVGQKMATALTEHLRRGDYAKLTDASAFAAAVTRDLREVSHDPHAMLERSPTPEAASAEDAKWARIDAENRRTQGFGLTSWRAGNVAVLVVKSLEPLDASRDAVVAHLNEIAKADALIIDLRENSGGDPQTVALLASYLFGEEPVHLNDLWWRDGEQTWSFSTERSVKGARFGPLKPIAVLVSHDTFSAGEELAYDLQAQKRATIVGATTRGGAHPVKVTKLSEQFTLRVPTGRAINPVTKTNWEGTGVVPDVACPPSDALATAEKLLSAKRKR